MTVPELRAAVVAEALSWLGTPYHHCADIKGAGVDCAMLLVRVYGNVSLVPAELDPRPYPWDWMLHRSEEMFLGWLSHHAVEVSAHGPAMAADVQVWQYGRCYSHAAVCLGDGRLVHAVLGERCVALADEFSAELQGRPMKRFRLASLMEPA